MASDRWQQVQSLFLAAVQQEGKARTAFLEQACAEDITLRLEVESLIRMHESSDHLLDNEVGAIAAKLLVDDQDESATGQTIRLNKGRVTGPLPGQTRESADALVGRRIDAYRITGLIGQGGMGSVYTAVRDDDQYRQKVAIKLVKAELTGGLNAESALQRFRRERQILARL